MPIVLHNDVRLAVDKDYVFVGGERSNKSIWRCVADMLLYRNKYKMDDTKTVQDLSIKKCSALGQSKFIVIEEPLTMVGYGFQSVLHPDPFGTRYNSTLTRKALSSDFVILDFPIQSTCLHVKIGQKIFVIKPIQDTISKDDGNCL